MNQEVSKATSIEKLIEIMKILRDPKNGCPWDQKQTHESLIPYLLEEAHEVADAIRENSDENLCEELGDLLLQIIFHSQIATEEKRFYLEDIIEGITKKLIRRHPHIFPHKKVSSIETIAESWEKIKKSEKKSNLIKNEFSTSLKEKIRPHPAITGSMYISKKTASIGFEWEKIEDIWGKLDEEIKELKEALGQKNINNAEEELGDVMFTIINIARWYKINPEEALVKTNKKFINRFLFIEKSLKGSLENQSKATLELLWREAKRFLNKKNN